MKAIIATVFIALFAQGVIAQIERGTFRIGPTFELLSHSDSDLDYKSSDMIFGVDASYFVIQNLGVGLDIIGQFSKSEIDGDETRSTSFGIGPQAMYMIGLSEQFYVPIYARYLLISDKSELPFLGEIFGDGSLIGFGTGIEYLVGKKLGLRLHVGYEIISLEYDDFSSFESKSSGIRSRLGIGVYF